MTKFKVKHFVLLFAPECKHCSRKQRQPKLQNSIKTTGHNPSGKRYEPASAIKPQGQLQTFAGWRWARYNNWVGTVGDHILVPDLKPDWSLAQPATGCSLAIAPSKSIVWRSLRTEHNANSRTVSPSANNHNHRPQTADGDMRYVICTSSMQILITISTFDLTSSALLMKQRSNPHQNIQSI